ncbi:MAG: hypothetical protein ACLR4M_11195 [Blautia sp.]
MVWIAGDDRRVPFWSARRRTSGNWSEGVLSRDRGIAYRHYCEKAAAHPNGVGCHYFQCYDQFVLGRFDGENYNIGLFDICSQPYPDMMEQIKLCSSEIYEVADGQKEPCEEKADSIPMIAY